MRYSAFQEEAEHEVVRYTAAQLVKPRTWPGLCRDVARSLRLARLPGAAEWQELKPAQRRRCLSIVKEVCLTRLASLIQLKEVEIRPKTPDASIAVFNVPMRNQVLDVLHRKSGWNEKDLVAGPSPGEILVTRRRLTEESIFVVQRIEETVASLRSHGIKEEIYG